MIRSLLVVLGFGLCLSLQAQLSLKEVEKHPVDGFPKDIYFLGENGKYLLFYAGRADVYNNQNEKEQSVPVKSISDVSTDSLSGEFLIYGKKKGNAQNQKEVSEGQRYLFPGGELTINEQYKIKIKTENEEIEVLKVLPEEAVQVSIIQGFAAILTKSNRIFFFSLSSGEFIRSDEPEKKVEFMFSNQDWLVTAHRNNTFSIWDPVSGEKTSNIQVKKSYGSILTADISSDSRFLAYGTEFGRVGALSIHDPKEHLVYKKRKQPLRRIAFVPGSNVFYGLHKFEEKARGYKVYGEAKAIPNPKLQRFNFDKQDIFPPQVYIESRNRSEGMNIRTKSNLFNLTGRVFDESGVFKLVINDIEVPFKEDGQFRMFIPLSPGDNIVNIQAWDTKENKADETLTITLMDKDALSYNREMATNHLLVIGINEYQNFTPLNNAVSDATVLDSILKLNYNVGDEHTTTLYNEEATLENINSAFRKIIKNIAPNDNLIIYYAGHGVYDNTLNEGYWVPVDGQKGKFTTYYPNSLLLKTIKTIPAQHVMVVADACFSGSLLSSKTSRGYMEQAEQYKSRRVITSGRLETVADGEENHSPFAATLLSFLYNNNQGDLTFAELELYMKKNFPSTTNQTPRFGVLNGVGDEGGEFILKEKK